MRKSVAARLAAVNELLRPNHCEVFLLDGYRPIVFWHYDWGNQSHVKNWRAIRSAPPPPAFYGYIKDPG